jgi:hypothetical protein
VLLAPGFLLQALLIACCWIFNDVSAAVSEPSACMRRPAETFEFELVARAIILRVEIHRNTETFS